MRFNVDPKSPDYHPSALYMTLTLDGVRITNAVEADDLAGTVRIIVGHDADSQILETRRGLVRFQVPHDKASFPGWPALPARYIQPAPKAPLPGLLRVR